MTTRTWDGSTNLFFTAAAWSPTGGPQPGDTAIINSGTAIANLGSLDGLTIDLNGSTTGEGTLRLVNSVIGATTKVVGFSTAPVGYLPATLDVQGTSANNGVFSARGNTGRFEVSVEGTSPSTGGILINNGAMESVDTSVNMEYMFGTPAGSLVNQGMIGIWNPSNVFQSNRIALNVAGAGTIQLNPKGVLDINGSVISDQLIDMTGGANAGETLQIDHPSEFLGTINGFSSGDTISLGDNPYTNYSYTPTSASTGTLNLINGNAIVAHLNFNGVYSGASFAVAGLGAGQSELSITTSVTPPQIINFTNAYLGQSSTDAAVPYTGPVAGIQNQYIWSSPEAVAASSNVPNVFLKGNAGDDALSVTGSGTNVLDGGAGSNFLVGSTNPTSQDTFFVDGRGGQVTWSTIVNFHPGDQATIFGFHPGVSTMPFTASDGTSGFTGATIHSELNGGGTGVNASMTFAGIDMATANAHFSITTGTLPGSIDYMLIQYNR